jgi:DNA sulfur modification protein DndE
MTIYRGHGAFVIGSEMSGGVRNVLIMNSTFIGTDVGLRFKTQRGRGGLVEKVFAQNITMKDIAGDAIHFDMYYGGKSPTAEKFAVSETTPRFQGFYFKDIVIQGAKRGIFARGLPEMNVKNVQMENLLIQAETGMYSEEGDGIAIKNLTLLTKDTNPVITLHNSKRMSFDNFKYQKNTENLFKISGETSRELRLANTDISNAKKDFQISAEVPQNIVNK